MELGTNVVQVEETPLFLKRPRTAIGPQGDHVTAYGLFQEYLKQLPRDKPKESFTEILTTLAVLKLSLEKYLDEFSESLDKEEEKKIKSEEKTIEQEMKEISEIITELTPKFVLPEQIAQVRKDIQDKILLKQIEESILIANEAIFDNIVSRAENIFLNIRNKLKYVSFPREGSVKPPKGEGKRVEKAIKTLRQYKDSSKIGEKEVDTIVEAMSEVFWYPKVPSDKLIKNKKEWAEIKKKKNYTVATVQRNNDVRILYYVTARHIDTVTSCFPVLNKSELAKQVIPKFIERIAKEWGMKSKAENLFKESVEKLRISKEEKAEEKKEKQEEMKKIVPETIPTKEIETQKVPPLLLSKQSQEASGKKKTSAKKREKEESLSDTEKERKKKESKKSSK